MTSHHAKRESSLTISLKFQKIYGTLFKTNSKFAPEKRPTQKGVDASARSKRAAQKASVLGRFLVSAEKRRKIGCSCY